MIHYITTNGIGNAWVANELKHIGQAGVPFKLHAMRNPDSTFHDSDWAVGLDQDTNYLYPLNLLAVAWSVMIGPVLFGSRYFAALLNALFGKRENFRVRCAGIAHFAVACQWARHLQKQNVSLIHSQWIHSCGTIGMYGAWLLDKPFSFTGHAADLYRERCALADKVKRASFIICISQFHREFYRELGATDDKLHNVYCGIDVSHFSPVKSQATGKILSSGRLVEKKGFTNLIEACKVLKQRGLAFQCTIGGSGPLESTLRQQIAQSNLEDCVHMTGQLLKQEDIPQFMHSGNVYCLPCVWAADGDVDGLPQMLMEAMACGLPAISTRLVGIPDLIQDQQTGLLVEPKNVDALANALQTLLEDTELADRLAVQGRNRVLETFNFDTCLEPLINLFRLNLGGQNVNHNTSTTEQSQVSKEPLINANER
jgi:colanic acid/amylovoran biosynthesis glycosyltransferase